jgi:hypothetical protein
MTGMNGRNDRESLRSMAGINPSRILPAGFTLSQFPIFSHFDACQASLPSERDLPWNATVTTRSDSTAAEYTG